MVAVTADVAERLPSPGASNDRETIGVGLYGLRRLLTSGVIERTPLVSRF